MSDLLERIAAAQRDAGERVVMDDLRKRGLLGAIESPKEPNSFADYCEVRKIPHGTEAQKIARWFYYRGILDAQRGILKDLAESISFEARTHAALESETVERNRP